jgi:hypothetical protein
MRLIWFPALLLGLYLGYYAVSGQYWFKSLLCLLLVVVAYQKLTKQT